MDVKTYQIAIKECDDRNEGEYNAIDDRLNILEDAIAKRKTIFSESFDSTAFIDKLKTTARIEQGTIKMPDYGKTKIAYDFDDFYEIDFSESYDVDIYKGKVVIAENADEGLLVTKWQSLPLSNEIDVSIISDISSRIRNTQFSVVNGNLVYLYSDDYDDKTYVILVEHTRTSTDYNTPKITIECYDEVGSRLYSKSTRLVYGPVIDSCPSQFYPVAGINISRSHDGSLLLGLSMRNTKAIYGYGDRGRTAYYVTTPHNLEMFRHYNGSQSWVKRAGSNTIFTTQGDDNGNAKIDFVVKVDINSGLATKVEAIESCPSRILYTDDYYGHATKNWSGAIGVESLSLPSRVETIRNGVVTDCTSYSNDNYGSVYGGNLIFTDFGANHTNKSHINSNAYTSKWEDSLYNWSEINNDSNTYHTYTFSHDGVIYTAKIRNNTSEIAYKTILKTLTDSYVFDKKINIANKYSVKNQTINKLKYVKSMGKLLVVTGKDQSVDNNKFTFEYHDIDDISRTIASTGDENNIKEDIDFEDRYGIVISSHFAKYGHTGSYFELHEDHTNGLIHLVFTGRNIGEPTSVCRLYHMNLNIKTLRTIGAPGQVAMTTTTQSDMYNYQNVSICNLGKDIWVSYMFSDGRDHSDSYIVKVERFNANMEHRMQTDMGDNIRIESSTQLIKLDHLVSKVRFTTYMDNRIGVTHHNSTNVDHIEFVHNGSKNQNKEFFFESEFLPLNITDGQVIFDIEYYEKDGSIKWFLSLDGNKWEPYTPGTYFKFNDSDSRIKLKAILGCGTSEYNDRFKTPFIRQYTMKVDGAVLQNDIVNLQVNLMKTNFKVDSFTNATKNGLSRMSIDVFNDESNIDIARSDYTFDSTLKLVYGKKIQSKPEKINNTMTNMLLVVDEVGVDINNGIKYYVSRDDGKSFIRIFPNVVTNIPKDGANDSIDDILVFKAEFEGNAKLTAWAWSWD